MRSLRDFHSEMRANEIHTLNYQMQLSNVPAYYITLFNSNEFNTTDKTSSHQTTITIHAVAVVGKDILM